MFKFRCLALLKGRVAKERQKVNADVVGLRFHISGVALAKGDNLELTGKRIRCILETRAGWRSPTPTIGRRAGSGDQRLDGAVQ
ncbi:hypothetical protein [Sphingomonas antarctica]|uniref:hypothetical protein n=1 Tax=Sphingomonas antarctica TaxID=2040274 RepID=UPI0039ED9606